MNPLASTTFSSGPQDKLATADVYTAGSTTINSIQDKKSTSSFDISTILSNAGQGDIDKAASLLKVNTSTGSVGLSQDAVFARLNAAVPAAASSIRNLSSDAKTALTNNFKDQGTIDFKSAGETFKIPSSQSADLLTYSDYTSDVNAYSLGLNTNTDAAGISTVYDIDSHACMIATGVTQGSQLGIGNSFSSLTQAVGSNSQLITKVTAASLPILVKNGDLGNLQSMSASTGGQIFDAILPSFGRQLTSNYSGGSKGASVSDYQSLISIFTNTNSSWNIFNRIGDSVGTSPTLNLLKLLGGTTEFQSLLAIGVKSLVDGDKSKNNILATMFSHTTVEDEIHRNFPRVVLQSDTTKKLTAKSNTIDPRITSLLTNASTQTIGTINI